MAQRPIHDMEKKWQEYWAKNGTYQAQDPSDHPTGEKFYGLIEFPYPSGDGLHVGHPRSYAAIDIVTRKHRMEGKNVLYPIGWDAFGLPTENYAIKNKIKPADATKKNIANFTRQIKSLGIGFDWSHEIDTTDPKYYKWTQWQFLQFVKAGLAYKAATTINWCPRCKIGLANEEAQGGVCERCGNPVEKREKAQWMIKITKYAERLIKDLDGVDYLEKIRKQQIDWIGKSEGAEIVFRAPKFEKVLVATNNKSKLTRAKKLMAAVLPSVQVASLADEGLQEQEIAEGSDLIANARAKAKAYRSVTNLPILGTDTGLFINGETELDPASPKRNALAGKDEATLSQEEKAHVMDVFYRSIAEKHGGEVDAYWKDVAVLVMPDGIEQIAENIRPIMLTNQRKGEMDIFFPVKGLYKCKATGKYHADHTEEEEIYQEFGPITRALASLCSDEVRVFTTRPDTLFGVTYVVLAPEHPLVQSWLEKGVVQNGDEVRAYIEAVKNKTDIERTAETKEKTGVALKGVSVVNPVNGESVPVWIADYALANYGTGAVMAVPAHDERDFAFAKKYRLPIKLVISPAGVIYGNTKEELEEKRKSILIGEECFPFGGDLINSGPFNGINWIPAKKVVVEFLEKRNSGKNVVNYRLRDWVFSRQRYWGEPIPLVHCEACAKKKQKVLILHGFSYAPSDAWYPWIKNELEKQGFEVIVPTLPCTGGPSVDGWFELLRPYLEQLDEDDVILGHSIGGRMAIELVERLQKKIGHLVLAAPAMGAYPEKRYQERVAQQPERKADFDFLRSFVEKPIIWDRVTPFVGSAVVLWSEDDQLIARPTHAAIPRGWNIQVTNGLGHFIASEQQILLEEVCARKVTGWIPVPDSQLPLTLPDVDAYEPTDNGESPLAKITDWVNTTCPKCGGPATRETDTMPNWAGSSWYFLRYCDPHNDKEFASAENLKYWMPVNLYNGGMEHTTLHLLYSRFWHKFLWDMGYIPAECGSEPYSMRRSHNMILGEGGVKMSKSKGNVINPDDVVKDYGSDVFRVYEMFIGPYDQPAPWDTNGIEGVRRFLDKVWNLFEAKSDVVLTPEVETLYHQTIKKVTDGIENLQFNTCISQMMILTNAFQEAGGIPAVCREGFLKILAPYAPHIAEELWEMLGHKETIHRSGWPTYDASKLVGSTFELVIQINGKVRDKMVVDTDISEGDAKAKVLASEKVQGWLEGKEPKKVVYVKGKLVSIVM